MAQKFEVIFLDVGQGDCTIINLPDGGIILIDVGPASSPVVDWLQRPQQLSRRIHAIVITHNDGDHAGALSSILALRRNLGAVYTLVHAKESATFLKTFRLAIAEQKAGRLTLERLEVGRGPIFKDDALAISLDVRHPTYVQNRQSKTANQASAVLCLVIQSEPAIIWPGDAHLETVSEAVNNSTPEVLVGPHHGGPEDWDGLSSPRIIKTFLPRRTFISVGSLNSYTHPYGPYVKALRALESCVSCSQLTKLCDRNATKPGRTVLNGSARLGYPSPRAGNSCRGSVRVVLSMGKLQSDDKVDDEHLQKIARLSRPACISSEVKTKILDGDIKTRADYIGTLRK